MPWSDQGFHLFDLGLPGSAVGVLAQPFRAQSRGQQRSHVERRGGLIKFREETPTGSSEPPSVLRRSGDALRNLRLSRSSESRPRFGMAGCR